MTLKEQFTKLKENWLIAVLVVGVLLITLFSGTNNLNRGFGGVAESIMYDESISLAKTGYMPYSEDFAPEVVERKLTKITSLSNDVERGKFSDAENKLKSIITTSGAYLLNENVRKHGTDRRSYYSGSYQLKVDVNKYDVVISQLKEIGEVTSFNENVRDVTGRYTNLQIELETENERLKRYQEMYQKAVSVSDQIELNDRIFNQERTIKYLEDALENVDSKVEYSTISVNLREKQSEYVDIALVKFSELIKKFINSFNSLIGLLFWAIPWAVIALIVWVGVRLVRRRK